MVANSTINITEAYDSLSQACFILWPTDKKKHKDYTKNDGFQSLMDKTETEDFINQRHDKYYKIWNNIKTKIDKLMFDLNLSATNGIFNFVSSKLNNTDNADSINKDIQLPFKEIPTGLIFSGINPDDKRMYKQIVSKIKTVPTNHVAVLESKDCINLKNTMKIIIEQLMETNLNEENENIIDATEFYKKSKIKKSNKAPNYDPYILLGWYKHLEGVSKINNNTTSPVVIEDETKEKENNNNDNNNNSTNQSKAKHKLILFIEDFECFDVLLLQDLISIFSGYSEELPIILLIGIATSLETFHQSLPISSLSLLQIEKFKLLQSYECINEIIQKVFIETIDDFKLGVKPYQYLLDNFNFLNLSVDSFIRGLKFSVMYHFYSNPLSILSSIDPTSSEMDRIFSSLTKRHLDEAKVLTFPSFKFYINSIKSTSPKLVYELLTDDKVLKDSIREGLINLHNYHIKFRVGFECLLELQKLYQSPLFKKSKRALYLLSLQESLYDSAHVQLLIKRSKVITYPIIKKFLETIKLNIEKDEFAKKLLENFVTILNDILLKFEKFDENGNEIKEEEKKERIKKRGKQIKTEEVETKVKKEEIDDDNSYNDTLYKREKVDSSKENKLKNVEEEKINDAIIINENGKRPQKTIYDNVLLSYSNSNGTSTTQRETNISKRLRAEELRGYETMVDEVNQFINKFFKDTLRCYKEFPYYEIIYYTESSKLKKSFSAQPRSVIHTALNYPNHYLNCDCCSDNDNIIESSLHDTCIAYKLYLECGKLINLYDWFVAFGNILKDKIDKSKKKEKEQNKRIKQKQKQEAEEIAKSKEKEIKKKDDIIVLDSDNEIENVILINENKEKGKFEEHHSSDEDNEEKEEEEEEFNEKEIQARFIRAISELQYFGFIKSTNRKVDHVVKLTWGSD
ncbi:hypothetical protein BCR36DRAFT_352357 [Piromyces finnis]|uniref:Origin recognition complex subunit 3 n=1 Tax=Piromyces finnis TaxID=1754191 RepID=A0A1Y1V9H6_9FUNG|nr:hypothetical protein BCR36DRAFT_352357 [Piromyces finnis]|eukprot:ORX50312.1 hypothetical protein BCR36DRAFT_352357 [Piromyces finnis]